MGVHCVLDYQSYYEGSALKTSPAKYGTDERAMATMTTPLQEAKAKQEAAMAVMESALDCDRHQVCDVRPLEQPERPRRVGAHEIRKEI